MEAAITTVRGARFEEAAVRALADSDILVVAGGDGTVRTAARYMLHTGKVLGILPCGRVNLMARDLSIPLDLPEAIAALSAAESSRVDTAEVNGQLFLCSVLIGLFPEISPVRERFRGRGLLLYPALAWATLRAIRRYPTLLVEIQTAAGNEHIRTKAMVVSNNPLIAKPGLPPIRPRLDSGLLEVYISPNTRTSEMIRLMVRVLVGTWKAEPGLKTFQTSALNLSMATPRMAADLDGEIHRLRTPLFFRMKPLSLVVLRPRG